MDATYYVYDYNGHCIGFTDYEGEAFQMSREANGRYELVFIN